MARRNALLLARNDVATAFRQGVQDSLGFDVTKWLAAIKLRRVGDTPGTSSHRVAHGDIPVGLWDDVVDILTDSTDGIRDSADWFAKGSGGTLADARWAIAYDGADIVAAFYLTIEDNLTHAQATTLLTTFGFAFTAADP